MMLTLFSSSGLMSILSPRGSICIERLCQDVGYTSIDIPEEACCNPHLRYIQLCRGILEGGHGLQNHMPLLQRMGTCSIDRSVGRIQSRKKPSKDRGCADLTDDRSAARDIPSDIPALLCDWKALYCCVAYTVGALCAHTLHGEQRRAEAMGFMERAIFDRARLCVSKFPTLLKSASRDAVPARAFQKSGDPK